MSQSHFVSTARPMQKWYWVQTRSTSSERWSISKLTVRILELPAPTVAMGVERPTSLDFSSSAHMCKMILTLSWPINSLIGMTWDHMDRTNGSPTPQPTPENSAKWKSEDTSYVMSRCWEYFDKHLIFRSFTVEVIRATYLSRRRSIWKRVGELLKNTSSRFLKNFYRTGWITSLFQIIELHASGTCHTIITVFYT